MTDEQYRDMRNSDGSIAEGFRCKIEVDPDTYDVSNKYFYDDKQCPSYTLTSQQAKNFAAYALIKKDLKYVLKAFKFASSIATDEFHVKGDENAITYRSEIDTDADMLKAFYISAIVTYGKCFTKADGKKVKLEYKTIFKGDEKELVTLHLEMMDQRHSYIAHGGKTKYETVSPVVVLHPDQVQKEEPILITQTVHVDGFGKTDFDKFMKLVTVVDERVMEILNTKSLVLYKKEIEGKPLSDLYAQATI